MIGTALRIFEPYWSRRDVERLRRESDQIGATLADALEDVLDGDRDALVLARHDGAAVNDQPRQVQPRQRHRAGRDGLVAADQHDHAVQAVAAGNQLDGIGHQLPRHQRAAHSLGAHRDPVGDDDAAELHRRASGCPDAFLQGLGSRNLFQTGSQDCNNNNIPDECDIADGTSADINLNGIPDECECTPGNSDINGDLVIDIIDRKRRELVWRGVGEGAFTTSNPSDKKVAKRVATVLQTFPPPE